MDPERFKEWCEWGIRDGDFNRAGGKLVCDTPQGRVKLDPKYDMISAKGVSRRTHSADDVEFRTDKLIFEDRGMEIDQIEV